MYKFGDSICVCTINKIPVNLGFSFQVMLLLNLLFCIISKNYYDYIKFFNCFQFCFIT